MTPNRKHRKAPSSTMVHSVVTALEAIVNIEQRNRRIVVAFGMGTFCLGLV